MGYHQFNSIAEYRTVLHKAIDDTMQYDIVDKAKEAMQLALDEVVYSYPAKYHGRPDTIESPRKDNGGLRDKSNISFTYIGGAQTKQLILEDNAPWQNVGFRHTNGRKPSASLAEVVETNGMYGADARPFLKTAEKEYGGRKFERDLQHGIIKRGF